MWTCAASVAWAAMAGMVSLVVGVISGSLALLAFGLSSVIDGSASAVLVWRFGREYQQTSYDPRAVHRVEHRATRVVGVAMLASAAYIVIQAGRSLLAHAHPQQSITGLVLLTGSLLLCPFLGTVKARLSAPLNSPALRGDGVLSLVGGALAATALLGVAANKELGWWWTDSVSALLISMFLMREGAHTVRASAQLSAA
ncbi:MULTISPECIES: cation transporter [Streptomyces]